MDISFITKRNHSPLGVRGGKMKRGCPSAPNSIVGGTLEYENRSSFIEYKAGNNIR